MPSFINNTQRAEITRLAKDAVTVILRMLDKGDIAVFTGSLSAAMFDQESPIPLIQERLIREAILEADKHGLSILSPNIEEILNLRTDVQYLAVVKDSPPRPICKVSFDCNQVYEHLWQITLDTSMRNRINTASPKKLASGDFMRTVTYEVNRSMIEKTLALHGILRSSNLSTILRTMEDALKKALVKRGHGVIDQSVISITDDKVIYSAGVVDYIDDVSTIFLSL